MRNRHHLKDEQVKRGYAYYGGLGLPAPVFFLVGGLSLWAVYHAISTRSFKDFLVYGGILGILLVIIFARLWYTEYRTRENLSGAMRVFLLFSLIGGAVLVGAFYYCLAASTYDLLEWVVENRNSPYSGPILASVIVLFAGLGLFWFRLRCRITYGITEILAGISIASYKYVEASASLAPADATNPNLFIVLLTAGVYLVVRGLDNIQTGLALAPIDPIVRPLIDWYRNLGEVVIEVKKTDSTRPPEK